MTFGLVGHADCNFHVIEVTLPIDTISYTICS